MWKSDNFWLNRIVEEYGFKSVVYVEYIKHNGYYKSNPMEIIGRKIDPFEVYLVFMSNQTLILNIHNIRIEIIEFLILNKKVDLLKYISKVLNDT